MRFNRRIELVLEGGRKKYNPKTSREEKEADKVKEVPCYLSAISMERSMEVFGDYKKEVLVAQLQGRLPKAIERVRIGCKLYRVLKTVVYRNRVTLYLEESHEN